MLEEHVLGRIYVKGLKEGVYSYIGGDAESIDKIIYNAEKYINLLKVHAQNGNEVLFVMADKFEELEAEKIGLGKHEEYHKMLRRLKEEYL